MSKYIKTSDRRKIRRLEWTKKMVVPLIISCLIMFGLKRRSIMIVAVLLCLVYLCFLPSEQCIEMMVFLISFENVFKLSITSSSVFTFLQIIVIVKIFVFEKQWQIETKSLISFSILVLYTVLFLYTGITPLLKLILGFLMLIGTFKTNTIEKINCKNIIFAYSMGIMVSSCFAFLFPKTIHPYVSALIVRLEDGSAIDRFSALYMNPNYYSIEVSLALAGNLVLFQNREENTIEMVMLGLPLSLLGILSQSKTFVLTLIIMMGWLFIYALKTDYLKTLLVIGGIFVIVVLFHDSIERVINMYFYRLMTLREDNATLSEITTGRAEIWKTYLHEIVQNPRILIFGNGIETALINYGAHSMFVELLYCMGIVGSALYLLTLFSISVAPTITYRSFAIFFIVLFIRAFSANIAFYNNIYYYYLLLFVLKCAHYMGSSDINKFTITESKNYGGYIR